MGRAAWTLVLLALVSAGCVSTLEHRIDDARNASAPQESTGPQESTAQDPNATQVTLVPTPEATPPPPDDAAVGTTPTPPPATPLPSTPTPNAAPPSTTPPSPTPPPASTPPTPTPAPAPAWPREGSFVRYEMREGQSFGGTQQEWSVDTTASWTYHDGDWRGTCDGTRHDFSDGMTWHNTTMHADYTSANPPHWPPFDTRTPPAVGQNVTVWYVKGCGITSDTRVFDGGTTTYRAIDGNPPEEPIDFVTHWSARTGLVSDWSYMRGGSAPHSFSGRLVATDAPS